MQPPPGFTPMPIVFKLCAFGMTLDLAYLLDSKALAETGSFSRAAFVRNVTQPAFSRRIRALEDWAGAPLFQRGSTPVTLTDADRAIGPAFEQAMLLLTQGEADAQAAAARSASSLHFAATHVLSFTFFPSWLRSLEGVSRSKLCNSPRTVSALRAINSRGTRPIPAVSSSQRGPGQAGPRPISVGSCRRRHAIAGYHGSGDGRTPFPHLG